MGEISAKAEGHICIPAIVDKDGLEADVTTAVATPITADSTAIEFRKTGLAERVLFRKIKNRKTKILFDPIGLIYIKRVSGER